MHEIDVVVIGAGAAGVAAARAAARMRGISVRAGRGARPRSAGAPGPIARRISRSISAAGWLHSADENEWATLAPTLGFTVDDARRPGRARPSGEFLRRRAEGLLGRVGPLLCTHRGGSAEQATGRMSDCFEPGGRWNAPARRDGRPTSTAPRPSKMIVREYALYHDTDLNQRIARRLWRADRRLRGRPRRPARLSGDADRPFGRRACASSRRSGEISARAAIVAVPPGVIANETLRFSPALPDKLDAAARAAARRRRQGVPRASSAPRTCRWRRALFGSRRRDETGSYTLRPFGRPVIDGYFGGAFARALGAGEGAFAAFAIEQICARARQRHAQAPHPIAEFRLGARSLGRSAPIRMARRARRPRARRSPRRSTSGCSSPASIARMGFLHRARRVSHGREGRATDAPSERAARLRARRDLRRRPKRRRAHRAGRHRPAWQARQTSGRTA